MNTIVGYVYDKLYGDGGGYPSCLGGSDPAVHGGIHHHHDQPVDPAEERALLRGWAHESNYDQISRAARTAGRWPTVTCALLIPQWP